MQAAVCYGNGIVKYENMQEPEAKENEIKIKVKACGICRSDIPRVFKNTLTKYPLILGHEFAGVIEKVGKSVENFEVGNKVTAAPIIPCNNCEQCKAGNYSLCQNYSFIGSRQNGAMAEYIVVPKENVIKLSDNVSFAQGTLFEPATVGLHALYLNEHIKNGYTAILGGGTIGLFTMQWAKIIGSKKVVVFGRDKKHLELATNLGADEVISTLDSDFKGKIQEITQGRGFDNVYETAGSSYTIKLAFELAVKKAHVCMIGTPTEALTFNVKEWEQLNRKEFKLTGSWMSYSAHFPGKEWEMTQKCFADGSLKYNSNIFYKKFNLKDVQDAFNLFEDKTIKVTGRVLLEI